jgi:hypothetical protein
MTECSKKNHQECVELTEREVGFQSFIQSDWHLEKLSDLPLNQSRSEGVELHEGEKYYLPQRCCLGPD